MLKIYINNEEVVANNDFTINKHMLNTPSVILNNVCPKEWKENKDYSSFYHPQDYSKCKIQDETYIPAEPGTYTTITGSATIQNVSASKLQEVLQLDGDTTQETTTGKNLLVNTNHTQTISGITFTINEDKSITIKGTATAQAVFRINETGSYTLNAGNYVLSTVNNLPTGVVLQGWHSSATAFVVLNPSSNIKTTTLSENVSSVRFQIVISNGTNLSSGITIYPMLESGSTASSYEPYTNGASPNPTYPQPINVVSGRQEIDIVGKNLINVENTIIGKAWNNASNTARAVCYIKIKPSTKYTISFNSVSGIDGMYNFEKINISDTTATTGVNQITGTKTITTKATSQFLGIQFNKNNISLTDIETIKLMIEEGETTTPTYEEYKGQSYEINLGKNLYYMNYNDTTNSNWNGVDITSTHTGYSINGTATSTGAFTLISRYITLEAGTYTMVLKNTSALKVGLSKTNYSAIITLNPNETSKSFTLNETTRVCLTLGITNGTQYNEENEVMICKGTNVGDFSPYKTPIELCKIGNYQDFIKKGTGKNLINPNSAYTGTSNGITTTYNENQSLSFSGTTTGTWFYLTNKIDTNIPSGDYTFLINKAVSNHTVIIRMFYNATQYQDITINKNTTSRTVNVSNNTIAYQIYCGGITSGTQVNDTLYFQLEKGNATSYEPYGMYNKWYIEKQIGKDVFNGSEVWEDQYTNGYRTGITNLKQTTDAGSPSYVISNYYKANTQNKVFSADYGISNRANQSQIIIKNKDITTLANFKTWLSTHNTIVYYVLATPTYTEITDEELLTQINSIKLIDGLNNVSITSPYLTAPIYIHYNYVNEETVVDLLFCGVVKNSGKISLNPREPHLTTLQILDFKDFLSSGELDGFVIYQKTILEAIQMVIGNIQDYGFVLGNVNILNPNEVIGAYSTKDKTAYDVFNYLADITQSRWTTRLIDENTVAIDFYDPTLMVEGTAIDYTQSYFENNLIDNMSYNYGSNNYRNKQVMTSNQVYSNISQAQTMVANGYQTQFPTEQPIGKINSIIVDNIPMSFATFKEKDMGYVADFYYQPGDNYIESDNVLTVGQTIIIEYISIVEGRQIITNPLEIDRIEESTGRKGIISRYETRNDATTSTELQKIGESYIKYKGTPEITITIDSRKNLWEVGQRVEFNAPIEELETEYMVRTKKINYIVSADTLFYTYELVSSFNSETEINYFDNQRAKSKGNIGEGEYISRNIDIESTANIIFYDIETTEVQVDGDNELNSILNSPFIS